MNKSFVLLKHNRLAAFVANNNKIIVELLSALFILLFVYTAISKISDVKNFQNVLTRSPLLNFVAPYIAWGLPTLELAVSVLLFVPKSRIWGLYSSLALMVGFTCYLGYMIYFTPNLPCTCGGVLSQLSWNEHLVFNIVFTLLALAGIIAYRRR